MKEDIIATLTRYITRPSLIRLATIFKLDYYNLYFRLFRSPQLLFVNNPFDNNWKYYRDSYLINRDFIIYKYIYNNITSYTNYYISKQIFICDKVYINIAYKLNNNMSIIKYYGYQIVSEFMTYNNNELIDIIDYNY